MVGKRDLPMRSLGGDAARLQRDMRDALGGVRKDLDAAANYSTDRAGDWAGSPPATLGEAAARLAYHISSGAGAVPILELP